MFTIPEKENKKTQSKSEKLREIIKLLQENPKMSNLQIAKKTNLPVTTVFNKTRRLKELKIITFKVEFNETLFKKYYEKQISEVI